MSGVTMGHFCDTLEWKWTRLDLTPDDWPSHLGGSVVGLQLFVVGLEALVLVLLLTSHVVHQGLDLDQLLLQHLHILHSWPLQLEGSTTSAKNTTFNKHVNKSSSEDIKDKFKGLMVVLDVLII